jgi:hypothetical protein
MGWIADMSTFFGTQLLPSGGSNGQVLTRTATAYPTAGWVGWQTPQAGGGVPPLTLNQIVFGGAGGAIAQSADLRYEPATLAVSQSPYVMRLSEGGLYMNASAQNVPDDPTHSALFMGMDNESPDPSIFWLGAKAPLSSPVDFKNWMGLSAATLTLYQQRITGVGDPVNDQDVVNKRSAPRVIHRRGSTTDPYIIGSPSQSTATPWAWVDSTLLLVSVTIPVGMMAMVIANFNARMNVTTAAMLVGISSGTPANSAGVAAQVQVSVNALTTLTAAIIGNGTSQTIGVAWYVTGQEGRIQPNATMDIILLPLV